jgi:putative tricarboxylic transport membrane protein
MAGTPHSAEPLRRKLASRDAGAGMFLVLVAALAWWQTSELGTGTLRQFGPGMLPRGLAVLIGICGVLLLARAVTALEREELGAWSVRSPLFILGAAVVFGLCIRPLGLALTGPLVVLLSVVASRETRWLEALLFAVLLTAFCLTLFKLLLRLPIPVAPWLLGY